VLLNYLTTKIPYGNGYITSMNMVFVYSLTLVLRKKVLQRYTILLLLYTLLN